MNQAYHSLSAAEQAEYNIYCLIRLVCAAKKDCLHWIYEGIYEAEEQGKSFPFTPQDAFKETYLTMLDGGPASTLKQFIKKEAIFVVSEAPVSLYLPPDYTFLLAPQFVPTLKERFAKAMVDVELEMRDIIEDYESEEEYEETPAPTPAPAAPAATPAAPAATPAAPAATPAPAAAPSSSEKEEAQPEGEEENE